MITDIGLALNQIMEGAPKLSFPLFWDKPML